MPLKKLIIHVFNLLIYSVKEVNNMIIKGLNVYGIIINVNMVLI